MTSALALLLGAMQLLAVVSTTPNISEDFKAQAIQVANYAIQIAQTEIAAQNQPTDTAVLQPVGNPQNVTPQQTSPDFGATIQPMDKSDFVVEEAKKVGAADPQNGIPYGTWFIKAYVLDSDGEYVQNAEILLTLGEYADTRKTDTVSTLHGKDYHRTFSLTPSKNGTQTLTFKSGDKTKQITLQVE